MNLCFQKTKLNLLAACLVFTLSGCAGLSQRGVDSAVQGNGVMIKQIIIVADASISMSVENKLLQEMDFLRLFVKTMPEENYDAGFLAFNFDTAVLQHLQPFHRNSLSGQIPRLIKMGGDTRLDTAIRMIGKELKDASGKTAVLIVSDGMNIEEKSVMSAGQVLLASYPDEICIHSVHIGADVEGYALLRRISQWTKCGSSRSADLIKTSETMHSFVREIFFGIKTEMPEGRIEDEEAPQADSDEDGVPDAKDECPNTPKGAKVDSRGCWVIQNLQFDFDKYVIKPEFYPILDEVVSVLEKNAGVTIQIDGHTDSHGTEKYNQILSENRAKAVMQYLVVNGIGQERLRIKGWGESMPIKPNDSPENMALNRRVELNEATE